MSSTFGPRPDASRRRPDRRIRWIGAALLTLPILELVLIITVGRAIGVLGTLLLLAAGAVAGVIVLRRVGASVKQQLIAASAAGTPPAEPRPGTGLLIPAGLLLIAPGFLSDVVGLVLLVPPVRRTVAARLGQTVMRRLEVRTVRSVRIVPGEVVDVQVTDVRPTDVAEGQAPHPRALPPRVHDTNDAND